MKINCNISVFYLDKTVPKGDIVIDTGKLLERNGYRIKIFNTINFKKSMHYNPFAYIHSEKPRHMERLKSLLPFPSLQISGGENGRDTYAVIDKDENRFRPLQLRKPSVKAKLAAKPVPGGHPTKPKDQEAR